MRFPGEAYEQKAAGITERLFQQILLSQTCCNDRVMEFTIGIACVIVIPSKILIKPWRYGCQSASSHFNDPLALLGRANPYLCCIEYQRIHFLRSHIVYHVRWLRKK